MRLTLLRAAMLSAAFALPAAPALAQPAPDAPHSFADLAAKLLPAVVNISSTTTVRAGDEGPGGPEMPLFPPGSPFEKFFHDFMNRNRPHGGPDQGGPPAPAPKMQSLGSGFIIDPSGIIVTNNHVIDGADTITVTLQNNTTLKAKLLGKDPGTDIAVLKVDAGKPLPALQFGDSDKSRIGDWVLAIGNPFGLGGSVTAGIISARGRDIHEGPYDDFIQTDAPINRGNSGGPLFNMDGQVIGINTAIYSPSGGSIGIGFAIPSNMARNVVDQLRKYGHARRGWLGVRVQQVTPDIAESLGLPAPEGALVAGVNDGSPAARAGLRNGDVITSFNGQPVKEMRVLPRLVAESPIGQSVPLKIWRGGKPQTLHVTVAEMPDEVKQANLTEHPAPVTHEAEPMLGMRLSPLTQQQRDKYQLNADQKGVVITDVAPGSIAAQRGLRPGEVIVEVQQHAVASPEDVRAQVEKVRRQDRHSVLVLVQGQDGMRWIPLPLEAGQQDDSAPQKKG